VLQVLPHLTPFQVGNTEHYTSGDWLEDITLAKKAHIDAFALNMAHGEAVNEASLGVAFNAARQMGFQLFFSFDYAGNGPWPKETVIEYIAKWGSDSQYFKHQGKPFVSTVEGPQWAEDWIDIKARTGCFFMPDWSSIGARAAIPLKAAIRALTACAKSLATSASVSASRSWASVTISLTRSSSQRSRPSSPRIALAVAMAGGGEYSELCQFSCQHGYCPIQTCACTGAGHLNLLEPTSVSNATTYAGDDAGLCAFACARNFCPGVCHTVLNPEDDGYGPGYDPITDMYIEGQDIPDAWQCTRERARDTLDALQEAIDRNSVPPLY
jgi:hypothetical protein